MHILAIFRVCWLFRRRHFTLPDTAKLRIWTLRFWVFRAQDCLPRDRCSVGTRHALFSIILVCASKQCLGADRALS